MENDLERLELENGSDLQKLKAYRKMIDAQIKAMESKTIVSGRVKAFWDAETDRAKISVQSNIVHLTSEKFRWVKLIEAKTEEERLAQLNELILDLTAIRDELSLKNVD